MRRSTRSILTVLVALVVAAPAAQARPASEFTAPGGTHLTPGQLHRIDGPQPVALAPAEPIEVTPLEAPAPSGTDLTPWIFVAAPFALTLGFGGLRKLTHKSLIPRRRHATA